MTLTPNTELQGGKYRIIKVLGQGGFGITYLAEQVSLGRKVCVKEFFMKDFCDRDEQTSQVSLGTVNNRAQMEKYQGKFLKEARLIARFDHPNVIRIIDVFSENNTAYYVMEFIDGSSLNDMVKKNGALPEAEALRFIKAVGEGLAYVHAQGVNHLDVKPGNIMVRDSDGRPVLIDFGMSKQYDEGGEQTSSTPIGISEGYAPLEQYNMGGVSKFSPQTDIYSLAATLYRLVTGQVPPKASDVMNEGLPEMPASVSQATRNAIEKAMQFRKKDRPATMSEFLSLLPMSVQPSSPSYPLKVEGQMEESDSTMLLGKDAAPAVQPQAAKASVDSVSEVKPQAETEAEKYARWKASQEAAAVPENQSRKLLWAIPSVIGVILCIILLCNIGGKNEPASVPFASEDGQLYIERQGNKYGFLDENGTTVIPCQYDYAAEFSEGLAMVELNDKWGYIDKTGRQVIPCQYDNSGPFSEGLAAVEKDDKWGYIDKTGRQVIPCQYDYAAEFSEGLAVVELNDKWGYIDKTGRQVIPCQYDEAWGFSEGLAMVELNDKWGYIDKTGRQVIPCQYDNSGPFSEGLAVVEMNGKCGYIDKTGRQVIPCQYDYVWGCFTEGLAAVELNDKWGYIDKTGRQVIRCKFAYAGSFNNGRAYVTISFHDDRITNGLIDRSGNIIKKYTYYIE